jgi:hypothetical protein
MSSLLPAAPQNEKNAISSGQQEACNTVLQHLDELDAMSEDEKQEKKNQCNNASEDQKAEHHMLTDNSRAFQLLDELDAISEDEKEEKKNQFNNASEDQKAEHQMLTANSRAFQILDELDTCEDEEAANKDRKENKTLMLTDDRKERKNRFQTASHSANEALRIQDELDALAALP